VEAQLREIEGDSGTYRTATAERDADVWKVRRWVKGHAGDADCGRETRRQQLERSLQRRQDYPYAGNPNIDTIAVRRIDASSFESINKKNGKVMTTGVNAVSKDRKTLTWTYKSTNAQGQITNGIQVFDKQ
jgi:hypothetical protein